MSCPDEKWFKGNLPAHDPLKFQLASVPGMGPASWRRLESYLGTPRQVLAASQEELRRIVRSDLARNIHLAAQDTQNIPEILEALDSSGTHILYPDSPPASSRLLRDGSEWHYLTHLGEPGVWDNSPVVGMVGRRQASDEGVEIARELAGELARRGVVVLSGMAQGIDRASHFGCLMANGLTVAVLPMGLLRFLREISQWRSIHDAVEAERLLLVSGAPPLQAWSVSEAMRRNDWIAAWCDALVVVEAGEKGGTWKTASSAARLGRPVWVVSGFGSSEAGVGNHTLTTHLRARTLDASTDRSELAEKVLHSCAWKDQSRHPRPRIDSLF